MGAVLEMSVIKTTLAMAALAGLVACGEIPANGLLGRATQMVIGVDAAAPARRPVTVPEEELLANPGKYIRVNIRDLGVGDTFIVAGQNGTRTTWLGGLGTSVTLDGGVVVATRGLPRDLMGANAQDTITALRGGGGTATRVHDFPTDQDQVQQITLTCDIAPKGQEQVNRLGRSINATRFEEVCRGEGLALTNVYWIDGSRRIVRSLQAVSPDAGYLQIDVF